MQGEKNSLKATSVSKGGGKKKQTQQNKTTNHKKPKKKPRHKPSNQSIEKIANCFSGIVQNPKGKDGKNHNLGLKSPQCQYCRHSLHILDRNAVELLHFQGN